MAFEQRLCILIDTFGNPQWTFDAMPDFPDDLDTTDLDALVDGVAAAPEGVDPDDWLGLVDVGSVDGGAEGLRRRLAASRAKFSAQAAAPWDAARLRTLREHMAKQNLSGFLIPRGDEHQGEYVASRSERLAWTTGFTGSAGFAVVLAEKAAVFVDGRYTLQAENEVSGDHFDRLHLTENPPADWLAARVAKGELIGFDPWLMTEAQVQRFEKAVRTSGAHLVAVEENPVDQAWADQPPPPLGPVLPHPEAFTGETSPVKRARLAESMKREGLDAVVLCQPDSIAWTLNLRGGDVPFTPFALGFAIVRSTGAVALYMDRRKLYPSLLDSLDDGVALHAPDDLRAGLDALGHDGATVRAGRDWAPVWVRRRLQGAGATLDEGDDPVQLMKACKNAVELSGIKEAHIRDGLALTRFLAWLDRELAASTSLTEMQAADRLEAFRRPGRYFRGLSFPTISGAGPNGAIVHYRVTEATNAPLAVGSLYLVDSGAQYLDGTTDVTRTVAVGAPSAEMCDRFTRVLKGHIALALQRFPKGTTGSQLDSLARAPLWDAGLDYDHGTGHGVGAHLSVHEGPQRISKMPSRVALKPGMVISNEPGYYKAGDYGIRIENLVTVVELDPPDGAERPLLGFETLTLAPIDRRLIVPSLLNEAERGWLDRYHARVLATHRPHVEAEEVAWLEKATAPIVNA